MISILLITFISFIFVSHYKSNYFAMAQLDGMEMDDMGMPAGMDMDGYGIDGGMPSGMGGMGGMGEGYGGMDPYGYDGYGDSPYGQGYGNHGGPKPTPPRELDSVDEIKEFVAEDGSEVTIIGYFSEDNEDDKNAFINVAEELSSSFRFGYSTQNSVMEDMKYGSVAIILHRPSSYIDSKYGDKPKARYASSKVNEISLKTFIKDKGFPLVGPLHYRTHPVYSESNKPTLSLFTNTDIVTDKKLHKYYTSRLRKIAKSNVINNNSNTKKLLFNIAHPEHVDTAAYGVTLEKSSDIAVVIKDGHMVYKMEDNFNTDTVTKFIKSWSNGEIEGEEIVEEALPQAPPEDDDEGFENSAVIEATDEDDFKTKVIESGKDTMIEFYAPWCGHCKSLKPEYKQAANELISLGVDTAQLVAIDATQSNELASKYDVQGYPTLIFAPGGDMTKTINYDGPRDAEGILAFIKAHADKPFN